MHRVITEGEGGIKIAREETFSSNIDRECVGRTLALFSDLFLPLKCSDLGPKLVYTYFRFVCVFFLKKRYHLPQMQVHLEIF